MNSISCTSAPYSSEFIHPYTHSHSHMLLNSDSSFVVRPATTSDLAGVQHLVEGVEGGGCVIGDVVKGVQGGRDGVRDGATPLSAMVAECANQIVGVAIVRREEVNSPSPGDLSVCVCVCRSCYI